MAGKPRYDNRPFPTAAREQAGHALKLLLAREGLSQAEACRRAGVDQAQMSTILNGKVNTSLALYAEIAGRLGYHMIIDFEKHK